MLNIYVFVSEFSSSGGGETKQRKIKMLGDVGHVVVVDD